MITPSTISPVPLSVRTNSQSPAPTYNTAKTHQTARRGSSRGLLQSLDSANATASESSCVTDVRHWHPGDFQSVLDGVQHRYNEENRGEPFPKLSSENTAPSDSVCTCRPNQLFLALPRPHGLPLDAITKQQSHSTLQIMYRVPVAKPLNSLRTSASAPSSLQASIHPTVPSSRRQRWSVDEERLSQEQDISEHTPLLYKQSREDAWVSPVQSNMSQTEAIARSSKPAKLSTDNLNARLYLSKILLEYAGPNKRFSSGDSHNTTMPSSPRKASGHTVAVSYNNVESTKRSPSFEFHDLLQRLRTSKQRISQRMSSAASSIILGNRRMAPAESLVLESTQAENGSEDSSSRKIITISSPEWKAGAYHTASAVTRNCRDAASSIDMRNSPETPASEKTPTTLPPLQTSPIIPNRITSLVSYTGSNHDSLDPFGSGQLHQNVFKGMSPTDTPCIGDLPLVPAPLSVRNKSARTSAQYEDTIEIHPALQTRITIKPIHDSDLSSNTPEAHHERSSNQGRSLHPSKPASDPFIDTRPSAMIPSHNTPSPRGAPSVEIAALLTPSPLRPRRSRANATYSLFPAADPPAPPDLLRCPKRPWRSVSSMLRVPSGSLKLPRAAAPTDGVAKVRACKHGRRIEGVDLFVGAKGSGRAWLRRGVRAERCWRCRSEDLGDRCAEWMVRRCFCLGIDAEQSDEVARAAVPRRGGRVVID